MASRVGDPMPTLPQLLDGTPPANSAPVRVDFTPGQRYRYSGGGVMIVQLALMDRLRRPYKDILRELVLEPLGMSDSTFEQPLPPDLAARAVGGHDGRGQPMERFVHRQAAAAGGLWTTPSDLARFWSAIERGLEGRSQNVSRVVATSMTTIVRPEEG